MEAQKGLSAIRTGLFGEEAGVSDANVNPARSGQGDERQENEETDSSIVRE